MTSATVDGGGSSALRTSRSVRALLLEAADAYADRPDTARGLQQHVDRLDGPLRVAISGKVKAGKSTLINALVGEQIAPTDAGECTRVVTWYRQAASPRVVLEPVVGPPRPLPVRRDQGRLVLDLAGARPEEVERLVVDWPSRGLRESALIDTPGIDSLSTAVSARTAAFLTPEDEPSAADVIVYLMRHLHGSDVRFLESFHDRAAGRSTMVTAIGVLSRADEIGAGRIDAMLSARRVAARYRDDPTLRQLCQTVVPVAGLLAESARSLRQAEFVALRELADAPRADTEPLLLSVDRFVRTDAPVPVRPEVRAGLLDRFGVYGVRLSLAMIRGGMRDASALAAELVRRSGLDDLRRVLAVQFTQRGELLKARSALLALDRVLRADPRSSTRTLTDAVERILAGAHEFRELRLLAALRGPGLSLPPDAVAEAERLLGAAGTAGRERLGLDADAEPDLARTSAREALGRWRQRAESPMTDRATAEACQVVVRSCEGLLAAAERPPAA